MVRHFGASFEVRANRRLIGLGFALFVAVSASAGCNHRRSSLRPVYGLPVETPCSGPDCQGTEGPSTVIEREAPLTDSGVSRSSGASTSPPIPRSLDEPELESIPKAKSEKSSLAPRGDTRSSNRDRLPTLDGPSAAVPSPSRGRPVSAPAGRVRQTSSRQAVSEFLEAPEDLFEPPKADRPWKYIVLHHSANPTGGYDRIDQEHRKVLGYDGCGYHFVIGNGSDSPDGRIEISRRWLNQKHGLHCRNAKNSEVNEYGIGICMIGDFDKAPPTAKQVAAAKALVAFLKERYEVEESKVGTHGLVAKTPTACPGKFFAEEQILGGASFVSR